MHCKTGQKKEVSFEMRLIFKTEKTTTSTISPFNWPITEYSPQALKD